MTDERLRDGLKNFSSLADWAIKDIIDGNHPNKFSLAFAYVHDTDEVVYVDTILEAKSLKALQDLAKKKKEHNKFYYELEKAAKEEENEAKNNGAVAPS